MQINLGVYLLDYHVFDLLSREQENLSQVNEDIRPQTRRIQNFERKISPKLE